VEPNVAGEPVAGGHVDGAPWGTVTYTLDQMWYLAEPCRLAPWINLKSALTPILLQETYGGRLLLDSDVTVDGIILDHTTMFDTTLMMDDKHVGFLGGARAASHYSCRPTWQTCGPFSVSSGCPWPGGGGLLEEEGWAITGTEGSRR